MEGYSVTEAASVLGVPTERVWELLARGVLSGAPEGETGMRVFLQPRPAPAAPEPRGANGGSREPERELSPFRELLTEFRNLTERYGQALLALGEARGEVATLRSRVDMLEARMDLRLPMGAAAPTGWGYPPTAISPVPTVHGEEAATSVPDGPAQRPTESRGAPTAEAEPTGDDSHRNVEEEDDHRGRRRGPRRATESFAQALARAEDPSLAELPAGRDASARAAHADVAADAPDFPREVPAAEPVLVADEAIASGGAAVVDAEAEPQPAPEAEPAPESVSAPAPEAEPAPEPLAEAELVAEAAGEAEPATDAEPMTEAEPRGEPEPQQAPDPERAAEAEPSAEGEPAADAEPAAEPEIAAFAEEPPLVAGGPEPAEAEALQTTAAVVPDAAAEGLAPAPALGDDEASGAAVAIEAEVEAESSPAGTDTEPVGETGAVQTSGIDVEPEAVDVVEAAPTEEAERMEPAGDEVAADGSIGVEPPALPAEPVPGTVDQGRPIEWDTERYTTAIEEPDWFAAEIFDSSTPDTAAAESEPDRSAEPEEPPTDADADRPPAAVADRGDATPGIARAAQPEGVEPEQAAGAEAPEVDALRRPDVDTREETMLWFGREPANDAGAAEMEVAATSTTPHAPADTAPAARRLPGGDELQEALSALGALGQPEEEGRPASTAPESIQTDASDVATSEPEPEPDEWPPRTVSARESSAASPWTLPSAAARPELGSRSESGTTGPASRAYRRLRRIFPG